LSSKATSNKQQAASNRQTHSNIAITIGEAKKYVLEGKCDFWLWVSGLGDVGLRSQLVDLSGQGVESKLRYWECSDMVDDVPF
jgi:hypothetical protein